MVTTKLQFLLDENVPVGLQKIFRSTGYTCKSIQQLGWNGFKDQDIAQRITSTRWIFITRDRDFQFLWEKYNLRVIHLMIEPAILSKITPVVQKLLVKWNYNIESPFLLIVQNQTLRFWQKSVSP